MHENLSLHKLAISPFGHDRIPWSSKFGNASLTKGSVPGGILPGTSFKAGAISDFVFFVATSTLRVSEVTLGIFVK